MRLTLVLFYISLVLYAATASLYALSCPQVIFSCLAGFLLHWMERKQRLQFKAQMPPAVAAMQQHVYGLPMPLVVAQVGWGGGCCCCDSCTPVAGACCQAQ